MFLSITVPPNDVAAHLPAIRDLLAQAGAIGKEAAENGNSALPEFHAVLDFRELLPDVGAAASDAATEASAGVVSSVGEQGDSTILGQPTRQAVPA